MEFMDLQKSMLNIRAKAIVEVIVKEKSAYETSKFMLTLEQEMWFKIKMIQVGNGYEFVSGAEKTNKKTSFQLVTE